MLAAPFIGSFLGVLVTRLPTRRTVLWGRSSCERCRHRLRPADLVPIASWLALRGRCRYCGAKIAPFHILIELAALGVALWAATVAQGGLLWASCCLGWGLLALAALDLRAGILADALTLPLAGIGIAIAVIAEPQVFFDRVIGAIAGFASFALIRWLYRRLRGREGLGLGDAKLLAAAGAWVGWQGLPSIVLIGAVLGLLSVAATSLRHGRPRLEQRLAFGPCLCLATWIIWLYGPVL